MLHTQCNIIRVPLPGEVFSVTKVSFDTRQFAEVYSNFTAKEPKYGVNPKTGFPNPHPGEKNYLTLRNKR